MSIQPWQTLSRKELLKHPRLHIVEDDVQLPDGKTTQYIRHAPAKVHSIGIIAINDKQEILLQKEYGYPPNKVLWQLPGGGTFEDEDIIEAAKRELSEECDLTAKTCRIIGSFYHDNRRSDARQYIIVCTDLSPLPGQKDAEEFLENHWIPLAKLKSMIQADEFENVNLLAALNMWFCKREGDTAPRRPDVSVKLILRCNDEAFMLKHHNNGRHDFPGGRMEWSESPEETLARELREELNYELPEKPKFIYVWNYVSEDKSRHSVHLYYLLSRGKKPDLRTTEDAEIEWMPKEYFFGKDEELAKKIFG